ncbi:MAG: hypothetical protein LAT68_05980 [Cyclobacteriaceae bacterium]|nr:hypothetical protein [Cyclobacteriaceae bacterium]MCH8515860.1 hypothetical protein [Cyclobacteriaceae bacterium]
MKRTYPILLMLIFSSLVLMSCDSLSEEREAEIKNDVERISSILCEVEKIEKKGADASQDELNSALQLSSEGAQLAIEMEVKYDHWKEKKTFETMMGRAMKKCK